jgi:DNA-binding NarL/FixJ family response regulator
LPLPRERIEVPSPPPKRWRVVCLGGLKAQTAVAEALHDIADIDLVGLWPEVDEAAQAALADCNVAVIDTSGSGHALLTQVRKAYPHLPCIALGGKQQTDDDKAKRLSGAGASHIVARGSPGLDIAVRQAYACGPNKGGRPKRPPEAVLDNQASTPAVNPLPADDRF